MRAFFILLLTIVVASCGTQNEPPENLMGEETYINMMVELQLLRTYQAQSDIDSTTVDSLMQAIFEKYDANSAQFKKSHRYYQNNLNKQAARIDSAIERLRKDRIRKADTVAVDSTLTNLKFE